MKTLRDACLEAASGVAGATKPPVLRDLPPFPPVAAQLMRVLAKEDFPCKEVAALVRADTAFSLEVLRLANSPLFGFRHEIKDIPHAVTVLGHTRLRGIVMTLAMKEFVMGLHRHEALTRAWRHNLACALATEVLAESAWVDRGLGYAAGLLHDVGVLAFVAQNSETYAGLMASAPDADTLRAGEMELFGMDHCEAGRWLLGDWGLPRVFQDVSATHHDPPDRSHVDICGLVHIGSLTADMAGFPIFSRAPHWDPMWTAAWFDNPVRARLQLRLANLPITIATKINSFDCDFLT